MKFRMFLTLCLVLTWGATAHAEADADATKWLERLFSLVQDRAFQTDYVVTVNGETDGMVVDAKLDGELLQAGPTHYTNSIKMEVKTPAMGETPMEVTSQQISDGETLWTETFVSAMGITQVGKISLADLEEILAAKQGLQVGQSSLYMDPMSQLEMMVEAFDISVKDISDGEVSLAMQPTEATLAQYAEMQGTEVSGVLVLREEDAVPVSVFVSLGTEMSINMTFEGFELMPLKDVPADAFTYVPAPDAKVVDLAPLLKSGM